MVEVTSVVVLSDYGLLLTFNDGQQRRFDMRPYLVYPVFRRLEHPGYFALARVEYGTVTWPGEIDIAPETLYAKSVPYGDQAESERRHRPSRSPSASAAGSGEG